MIAKIYDYDLNKLMQGKVLKSADKQCVNCQGEHVYLGKAYFFDDGFKKTFCYHDWSDDYGFDIVFETTDKKEFKAYLNDLLKTSVLKWHDTN